MYSARLLDGGKTGRQVFRFGQKVTGELLPTVPARFRGGPGSPSGWLVAVRLRPASGEGWLRLRTRRIPGNRHIRTIPLNETQSPAPTPDSIEVQGGAQVFCHDGYIGRLGGITYDPHAGVVLDLVVHVRGNVVVATTRDPLAALQRIAGRDALLSPAWAVSTTRKPGPLPLFGSSSLLLLSASAEQVGAAALVRTDGELIADLWARWNSNPALAPYIGQLDIVARDGAITLLGSLPTPRQRATAEQDAWHVDGVFAVRNAIQVRG